jgi:hypothetical protein
MVAKKKRHSGAKRPGDVKRNIASGGEVGMNLEYLLVSYKENSPVLADGTLVGATNHILMLPPGGYDITLQGGGTTPANVMVDLSGTSLVRPKTISFT